DQLMAAISDHWAETGNLKGGGIVATVMSNLGLERHLAAKGLELVRTQVGDRYVVEHMRRHGFNVGGEKSGHIVMSDFGTTGDGLVAALQVLSLVLAEGRPVSEVCRRFEAVPQLLRNVRYSGASPLESPRISRAVQTQRSRLGGKGRLLVRPSGTEPLIRVMAEGDDQDLVHSVVDELVEMIGAMADD
ncbi:MAG: phosphoglucosamine mutase, partial [Alphaproteobacteria bacterium]